MKHAEFLIWMLLFPLVDDICSAIRWQFCERRRDSTDNSRGLAAALVLAVYFVVGVLLW